MTALDEAVAEVRALRDRTAQELAKLDEALAVLEQLDSSPSLPEPGAATRQSGARGLGGPPAKRDPKPVAKKKPASRRNPGGDYVCSCGERFSRPNGLSRHQNYTGHSPATSNGNGTSPHGDDSGPVACAVCGRTFDKPSALSIHMGRAGHYTSGLTNRELTVLEP